MASPPFSIAETSPGDTDIVAAFPTDERSFRDTVESFLTFEHDATTGRHKIPVVTTAAKNLLTFAVGSLVYDTDSDELQVVTSTGPTVFAPAVPAAASIYSEGSWTPVLAFGGASVGITYAAQVGRYVKISNTIHAMGRIALSANGSSVGDATITGLPFTSANDPNMRWLGAFQPIFGISFFDEFTTNFFISLEPNSTSLRTGFYQIDADSAFDLPEFTFSDSCEFFFNITYVTS